LGIGIMSAGALPVTLFIAWLLPGPMTIRRAALALVVALIGGVVTASLARIAADKRKSEGDSE